MGKATRRGVLAASAVVAGLVIAPSAMAVVSPNATALDPDASSGNESTFYRFASKNRVLTALYAAQNTSGWGNAAVLASSEDFSDALAAAPVAEQMSAPILLANANGSLDPQVAAYLATFDTVYIASGPGVIPDSVANGLESAGVTNVWRVAGQNRYETAAVLAVLSLLDAEDDDEGYNYILADGQNFPDALAAGPAAAHETNGVILLTAGSAGVPSQSAALLAGQAVTWSDSAIGWLPSPIANWLPDEAHPTITVVGGAAKAAAEAGVMGIATEPIEYDSSIVGKDRYETAALVAEAYFGPFPTTYTLASGEDFPDAVVAGGWAANADGPLVLTRNAAIPTVTLNYLLDAADNGDIFVVFGGSGSVSKNVSAQLQEAFDW